MPTCILEKHRVYTESTFAETYGQIDGQIDIIVYIPYTVWIHYLIPI